jgi:hypothetical protein
MKMSIMPIGENEMAIVENIRNVSLQETSVALYIQTM